MERMMTAVNLRAIGDLRIEQVPVPVCKTDEVLVRVGYCGICGSDLPRVYEKGTYHFPTVIGHEFSGTVVEDSTGEWLGKRVAVFPLLPCFSCEACRGEQYALCSDYDYYGSRRDGGMAEYIAVKRWNCILLPEEVGLDAGAMCEPAAVAYHAINRLGEIRGSSLVIAGAGPIGLLAAMWARHFGAREIYLFDLDEQKLQAAERLGFEAYREGIAVDFAIEGTGASNALARCLSYLKPFGSIVLLGNPAREMTLTQKEYWLILRKELRLLGTWNSSFGERQNDWREAIAAMQSGIIEPQALITHRIAFTQATEAFEMMRERKEFYQKVMLEVKP